MCLFININLKNHKYSYKMKKFWKYLKIENGKLLSPHYQHEWKPGWNRCDEKPVIIEQTVTNGIHVRLKKPNHYYYISVPVYANGSNLIAYGLCEEAAFTKVFLKKEDYLKALNQ